MKNLSNNELLENIDSKYSLVTVISKRARQILEGSTPLVERESEEEGAISIAIREYKENLIEFYKMDKSLLEDEEELAKIAESELEREEAGDTEDSIEGQESEEE